MPTLNSYIASIVVNGQKLTEYDPPEAEQISDKKKCVKYVEADEGSNFVVHIDLTPQTRFTTPNKIVRIYIDGKSAKASVIRAERTHRGLHHEYSKRAILEVGGLVEQAFMFKKLITTEETLGVEELKKTAKGIGSIRLEIYNGTADKSVPRGSRHTQESSGAIPEKALKGQPIDMMAGYGDKKPVQYRNVSNSKIVGKAEAVFEFKYRSRRALQLLDLVPTTPEPEALCSGDKREPSLPPNISPRPSPKKSLNGLSCN